MISKLLEFLDEDVGNGDITTKGVIPQYVEVEAEMMAREDGLLAGLEESRTLLKHFNLNYHTSFKDGDEIKSGDIILSIRGDARKILVLERVMLNIMMRMSGIATATRRLVEKCKPYGVTVAGTRKTTPGFRHFEKKAIRIGGGYPHRFGLDDGILIKDNHIATTGLIESIERMKEAGFTKKIEVEVSSPKDAMKACEAGADIIMLDNMEPKEIGAVISELEEGGKRGDVKIELSGNITPENIEDFARTKPDIISMGYLTTKASWLDMGMSVRRDGDEEGS